MLASHGYGSFKGQFQLESRCFALYPKRKWVVCNALSAKEVFLFGNSIKSIPVFLPKN